MVKTPPQHWTIPLPENGDKLNRYEFERRYNAIPNLTKAELVEGIVHIMPATLRFIQFLWRMHPKIAKLVVGGYWVY